jgi:hypothetical protein
MLGYILSNEQKETIQGVFFTPATFFHCVKDINDVWFLFLSEQDKQKLPEQYLYLLELPTGEYIAKPFLGMFEQSLS